MTTVGEVVAAQRAQRRAQQRTETDVERACDALALVMGFEVIRLSQVRASRVHYGLPDRYYRHAKRGIRLWFELKAPGGKLTAEQLAFLTAEHAANGLACCGTDDDLRAVLVLCARVPHFAVHRRCGEIVRVWASRGLR